MSEGVTKALTNPYVLAGGAALGIFLLLAKGGGTSNNGASTAGAIPYSSAALAYNMAGLEQTTRQAAIAADVGKAAIQGDVTKQVALLAAVTAHDNNIKAIRVQNVQSAEGIIKAQLETQSAVQIDLQNNMARMFQAQQQVTQTAITSNAQVQIAKTQAKAVKKAAMWGAFGKIGGAVTDALLLA